MKWAVLILSVILFLGCKSSPESANPSIPTGSATTLHLNDRPDTIPSLSPSLSCLWMICHLKWPMLWPGSWARIWESRCGRLCKIGSAQLQPFPSTRQYAAESIQALALQTIPNLSDRRPDSAFIVVTRRDINTKDRSLRFNFATHWPATRVAVVSTARLGISTDGRPVTGEAVHRRLYKMLKRTVGDVYFGYLRSGDIRDVMYSPIMGLDDIDRMGSDYLARKQK